MRHPFPAQPDRQLTPNTRVQWQAAAVGGLMAGSLWHVNNLVSVNFVSRVTQSNAIYGSLGMVPVFMIGLYFGWLILLFGAQVSTPFKTAPPTWPSARLRRSIKAAANLSRCAS